jgi:hypothetical protein
VFSQILVEFLFRLTFGVAVAMGVTDARQVTSGFFRVHLWALLGLQTLAALALGSAKFATVEASNIHFGQFWLAVIAAWASYAGGVIWMYERRVLGKVAIATVGACALAGCVLPALLFSWSVKRIDLQIADRVTSGLLLGMVTTAMLLGHWYLNTPTMKLAPLKRLIVLLVVAAGLRIAVCSVGTWLEVTRHMAAAHLSMQTWAVFVSLRWLAGVIGVLVLTWLTWQTLKIPNTQSATGILYAAVVLVFIGELMSQLLSAEAMYPV